MAAQNSQQTSKPHLTLAEKDALDIAPTLEAHRGERHLVILHDFPDPDAIAAAYAHKLLSQHFEIEIEVIYDGKISHRQNIALVRLLGIELTRYEDSLDLKSYDGAVFVDSQGTNSEQIVKAMEKANLPVVMVVDHHERQDRFEPEFADIRKVGATATIYTEYLSNIFTLDSAKKVHVTATTALMHGLISDTNNFIQAKEADFRAAAFLSRYCDAGLLEQILNQSRSRQVMEVIGKTLRGRITVESFSIAGIGYLGAEHRDAIPQAADFLLTEENVHTAIVYGIVVNSNGHESVVGALRTSRLTMDPDDFIKSTIGQNENGRYYGGGKDLAGGFQIPVGFLSGDSPEDYRQLKWKVYDNQLKQKIFGKIGVEG